MNHDADLRVHGGHTVTVTGTLTGESIRAANVERRTHQRTGADSSPARGAAANSKDPRRLVTTLLLCEIEERLGCGNPQFRKRTFWLLSNSSVHPSPFAACRLRRSPRLAHAL